MKRKFLMGIPVIVLIFAMMVAGCGGDGDPDPGKGKGTGTGGDELVLFGDVSYTMTFDENVGGDDGWYNHPEWNRWNHAYRGGEFDLGDMYDNDKVIIFTYSFSSNIDVDHMNVYFVNMGEPDWNYIMVSEWTGMKNDIKKNTKYEGAVVLIPNDDAVGCDLALTYLSFQINNRNVAAVPVLYFYEFDLDLADKEIADAYTWTISGRDFLINNPDRIPLVLAENLPNYQGKNNVLHIKPLYGLPDYGDFPIEYDLSSYAGKTIEITMSMDVYLKKDARIAWQINNNSPTLYYPVVCGVTKHDPAHPSPNDGPAQTANTWHSISGTYTYTVPNTPDTDENGKLLYLSGMQIEGAEAYFANASITITEQ